MTERGSDGKFVTGNAGGPGRPPKEREERYRDILINSVSFEQWKRIIDRAARDAEHGDATARKWLSDYIIGPPVQKSEVESKVVNQTWKEFIESCANVTNTDSGNK